MQKLGQHFLKSPQTVKKIVEALDVQSGETIVEIGPGHGELTIALAEACKKTGAKIIAIEKDKELAEGLIAKIAEREIKSLELAQGNALEVLPELIAGLAKEKNAGYQTGYKIVGNIPYYITGHLLRIVGELEPKPTRCVFMIQKEVAERACATPPKMNRLAASVQFWSEPEIIARVPKADFSPPPKIDSAVIRLETKNPERAGGIETSSREQDTGSAERYYAAMRALFAQPRKTILNNLADAAAAPRRAAEIKSKEKIAALLESIGIDPVLRPQNLAVADIAKIAKVFF